MSRDLSSAKLALLSKWREGTWLPAEEGITATPPVRRAHGSIQQVELWNLHQREPGTASTNISYAAVLDGPVDAKALGRAVDQLIHRHETLRTTLWSDDEGVLWQEIHDEPITGLEYVDLASSPDAEMRARHLADELAATAVDLVAGPLARMVLYRLTPRRNLLVIVVHHAIGDGWSLAIAMSELGHLYGAALRDEAPTLPDLPIQYRDYCEWQWQWRHGAEARSHATYWGRRLGERCAVQLPPDGAGAGSRAEAVHSDLSEIVLPESLSTGARDLAAREQASLFMVLLAAFCVLLRERTGDPAVSVGTPVAGRNRPHTRPLIGCFAGQVPMLVPVRPEASFVELVRATRLEAAEVLTHQEYALDMYLNFVEPERLFSTRPLYTAQFGLQPTMQNFELGGVPLQPVNLNRGETRTSFAFHLWNSVPAIRGTVGYSVSRFRAPTVGAMVERYLEILEHAVADPATSIRDL